MSKASKQNADQNVFMTQYFNNHIFDSWQSVFPKIENKNVAKNHEKQNILGIILDHTRLSGSLPVYLMDGK